MSVSMRLSAVTLEAERRLLQLGATRPEYQPNERWRVLVDPAGHPFCLTTAG